MADPCIIGWAHGKFGKSAAAGTEELMAEVVAPALDHAGVTPGEVDGIFVGCYNNGFQHQDFQGALVAMGTPGLEYVPAMRTENACATGSAALYSAMDLSNEMSGARKLPSGSGVPRSGSMGSIR